MPSPSVEVVSVEWGEGTDKSRLRRISQLLFSGEGERDMSGDGAGDDTDEDDE